MDSSLSQFLQSYCQTLVLQRPDLRLSAEFCLTLASLNTLQKDAPTFLHKEELDYLATLSFAKRQQSYLLGRYAAKQAVNRYNQNLMPTSVSIVNGIFEQPIVYYSSREKIQIALSHSEFLSAALVFPEEHPMGVDIELIQPEETYIATQLTLTEREWINQCNYAPLRILYTLFWTIKEALSKVLRTGMMSPFEIYAIKSLVYHEYYWTSDFENFAQYQSLSFLLERHICSIVYPKQTKLIIDIEAFQQWIKLVNPIYKLSTIE